MIEKDLREWVKQSGNDPDGTPGLVDLPTNVLLVAADALASALERLDVNVSFVKQYQTQVVNLKEQLKATTMIANGTARMAMELEAALEQLEAARRLVEHRRIFKCTSSILRCKVYDVLIDKLAAALPPAPEVKHE